MTATTVTLHIGDVRDVMATLPDNCADVLITSPPFLALRSYLPADHPDKHRELGSESTPAAFLDSLYGLTEEWGRLVPEWGSICVELGDTMSGSGGAGGDYNPDGLREGQPRFRQGYMRNDRPGRTPQESPKSYSDRNTGGAPRERTRNPSADWPLAKSMCLIPHLYTIGLAYGHNPITGQTHQAGQWRIRNVITWARPNPPVGSLGKRNPTKRTGDQKFRPACSYITVACRGSGRYFDLDAVRNPDSGPYNPGIREWDRRGYGPASTGSAGVAHPAGAPPLDWHQELDGDWLWKLATAPYPGAHYATYPLTLPRRLVLAMCPQRVCTVCGWPSERISRATAMLDGIPLTRSYDASSRDGSAAYGFNHNRLTTERATLGWSDCGHNTWRPGTVCDPFAGTGTTAVAAALESRDCTLIDLDARNVHLVDRRLREALHVTGYTVDGNTHSWTLDAPLPGQRAQTEGQGNLFDWLEAM